MYTFLSKRVCLGPLCYFQAMAVLPGSGLSNLPRSVCCLKILALQFTMPLEMTVTQSEDSVREMKHPSKACPTPAP